MRYQVVTTVSDVLAEAEDLALLVGRFGVTIEAIQEDLNRPESDGYVAVTYADGTTAFIHDKGR